MYKYTSMKNYKTKGCMPLQLYQLTLGPKVTLEFKICQKRSSQKFSFPEPHRTALKCLVIKDEI